MKSRLSLIVCVVVSACTTAPRPPAAPAASSAPGGIRSTADQAQVGAGAAPVLPNAPLTSNSGAPVPGATATSLSASASAKPDAKLLKEGYQPANYHGQTMYCRVENPTGSRFSRKVCLSAEQIQAREQNVKDVLGTVRSDTSCAMLPCQ
jgi:hypothetical protein